MSRNCLLGQDSTRNLGQLQVEFAMESYNLFLPEGFAFAVGFGENNFHR